MRIAQIAPLWERVPPRTYGGTELVVSMLTDELVRRGHDVTLFATGDSLTLAHLDPGFHRPFRGYEKELECENNYVNVMALELKMLGRVFKRAHEFDVIHNHMGFQPLPFAALTRTPMVTTMHNGLQPPATRELFDEYAHLPCISISDYQRTLWPELNYAATIYHGIEPRKFIPRLDRDENAYLAFLGRFSKEKGPHHAIAIARALGRKLIMAGKIDRIERPFFEAVVAPQIDGEQICYIGEVDHEQKVHLLRNAAATLCPVVWPEPFGLVLIESLACGTPVLALRDGSIPEIIQHGVTGFIGHTVPELIEAFRHLDACDRGIYRREAEQRFSITRMVDDHEQLYARLAGTPADIIRTPSQVAEARYAPRTSRSGSATRSTR